ncbi:MAG: Polyketide cyclase/dehydrase [Solirubrobacterales bacterium]|nr:Polyketide cyclase/dehydrase [Solirubrobacterales bacterium]
MPTIRVNRTISAPPERIWKVLADPYSLPRWWPRVNRVEGAEPESWTHLLFTKKGRGIRADFVRTAAEPPVRYAWAQQLDGTPFARFLVSAEWEVRLAPGADGTEVTLELRQKLQGWSRFAPFLFRRAGRRQLAEALEGLDHICG